MTQFPAFPAPARRALPLLLVLLLAALSGCSKRPPAPRTDPAEIPGYTNLNREFGPLDFSPLTGRRIVLDPGHGGYFRGAVGPDGLTEAEVNLGVALYLRGLLEWAGSEVHMTRTADYDFLSPADSSLSSDLAFRINFANELQPDVFISIHHNSTASADPTINETQTYYPIGMEGTCLDLARSIHRHLVLNLEISPARILPGNFHVLRKAEVPAVLGEPAMISNPVIEGRLTLAASHELEARAYFLGLLDYFAGGSPGWASGSQDTTIVAAGAPFAGITWSFDPGGHPGDPGPDPGTFDLTRNGLPEPFLLTPDGHGVIWTPRGSLPAGPVVLELTGRNLAGRSTPVSRKVLLPHRSPLGNLEIRREDPAHHDDPHDLIRWWPGWQGQPEQGRPGDLSYGLADGFALVPRLDDPRRQAPALLRSELGLAPAPDNYREGPPIAANRKAHLITLAGRPTRVVTEVPPGGWHDRWNTPDARLPMDGGQPYLTLPAQNPVWVQARGVLPLVDPAPTVADTARSFSGAARHWQAELLVPSLYGAVIVLDPRGGGTEADGTGPLGTRGADINLATALRARHLLEGAGATVHLTRSGEVPLPAQDKVRLAGRVGADLFLTIGRSPEPGRTDIAHHHGSVTGQVWAEAQAQAAAELRPLAAVGSVAVKPSYAYLLRHTACPALEVGFPPLGTIAREAQASTGAWQLAEARAILLAAAAALGEAAILDAPLDVGTLLARLPADRALPRVDWALVDGNFPWLPPEPEPLVPTPDDSLSYYQTGPGDGPGYPALAPRHTLEIHQGTSWQLWLIDAMIPEGQPRLMLEGR
jgi:N-acetylmuramoyl-L-alanine amidase